MLLLDYQKTVQPFSFLRILFKNDKNNSTNIAEDGRARYWLLLFANLKLFHSPLAQTWTWKEKHFAALALKIHKLICIGLNMSLMLFAGLLLMIFFTLCIQNVAFFVA